MHKIDREEWAFAMDTKDPQYEEKFEVLFRKYYENTLEAVHLIIAVLIVLPIVICILQVL